MKFNINCRDGPARIGEFLVNSKKIKTPNIAFIDTSRFKAPDFSEFITTNQNIKTDKIVLQVGGNLFSILDKKNSGDLLVNNFLFYPKDVSTKLHLDSIKHVKIDNNNCCIIPANIEIIDDFLQKNNAILFIVSNASQLFFQQSNFIEFIVFLREKIGYQRLIYLPSIGDPLSFAFFAYLGVDFFDSSSAIIAARNNILLFPTGFYNKNVLNEIACCCPSCKKLKIDPCDMSFQQILNHNYFTLYNEIKNVRNAIFRGDLRELVETRVSASPHLSAMLKILDKNQYEFLEKRTPIIRKNFIYCATKHSLFRPEVIRFQNRVINRYKKPDCTKILLLLPCSAKKPYSFSKSHKLFKDVLLNIKNPNIVHELIITSPIGLVPRELELIYPASRYEISVSGHWYEDEKQMIRTLLKQYLKQNDYDEIIIHLPQNIQVFINDLFKKPIITCDNTPISKKSLEKLSDGLIQITDGYNPVDFSIRVYENMFAIASYQFGKKIAQKLLENCKIRGKYPFQKIMHNNIQLGMLTKDRGLISLTFDGAKRIATSNKFLVEIYDDFNLVGSVFAPGVKDADEKIRIGDEVVVIKNKTVCGVGVAMMNGVEMKVLNYGEAVKIRHRH